MHNKKTQFVIYSNMYFWIFLVMFMFSSTQIKQIIRRIRDTLDGKEEWQQKQQQVDDSKNSHHHLFCL